MILAAGLGTRMQPVTDHVPKPLLPVAGLPLLEIIVRNLAAAGVVDIGLNTHHLADHMARFATELEGRLAEEAACPALTVFFEPEILGTGGALGNARAFLERDDTFFLHNGDVLSDLDLQALAADHQRHGALATLALRDWEPVNTVLLAADGTILDIAGRLGAVAPGGSRSLTYTGVAVLSREVLAYLPEAGYSTLVAGLIVALADRPGAVRGWVADDCYWNDLGTVGRYLDAHRHLLTDQRPKLPGLGPSAGPVAVAAGAEVAPEARLSGFVSVGAGCRIEAGARLEDCVVLDGAAIPGDTDLRRAVIAPGWAVVEGQAPGLEQLAHLSILRAAGLEVGPGEQGSARAIVGHGSDRRFWRLATGERRAILMQAAPDDAEFERFAAIGALLREEDLGGPEILAVDPASRSILMEDLGEDSLYRRAADPAANLTQLPRLYRQVLDLLVEIQTRGTAAADGCLLAVDRLFDRETLRWETDYFRRRFLAGYLGLPAADLAPLDDEFDRLATAALAQPVVLMHRDFQSQNILLKEDRVRLVDFQGMRRGPLAYDPMSLLRDAYVDLGADLRVELLEYYRERLAAVGGPDITPGQLGRWATVAGLQRNMQALGAFAFLSQVKGKPRFRRHIPLGLKHLADGLGELRAHGGEGRPVRPDLPGSLPHLERTVAAAATRLGVEGK